MEGKEVMWGTWEELLLGGAVLRHGARDWDTIAAELRSRALSAYTFTPQVCRAKYDDLQQRNSKCTTWFEEVRKKRMAELRQALEVSEGSIGSLETKLETLKAEKEGESRINYASSQTESPLASHKSEGFESLSKDGLSAGSFTVDHLILSSVPAEDTKRTPEVSLIAEKVKSAVGTLKKRRGARKRKDCSIGESGGVDLVKNHGGDSAEVSGSSVLEDGIDDLLQVLDSIEENECASRFRQRLDSQKRGRYKKMIRKHVDFETLRSRVASRTIVSVKELFRDIMLLANNALVFYSKNTREYKSARLLRDHATKSLHRYFGPERKIFGGASSLGTAVRAGHVITAGKKNSPPTTTGPAISDVSKAPKRDIARAKRPGPKGETESPIKGRKRVRTSK